MPDDALKYHYRDVTDDDLLKLDGLCAPKTQAAIDEIKRHRAQAQAMPDIPTPMAVMIADAVQEAKSAGLLIWQYAGVRSCPICAKSCTGYSGRGRQRRANTMAGIELADRFIRFEGRPAIGCCRSCMDAALPRLREALAGVEAELPEALMGFPPKFKRYKNMKCSTCGWQGHEGQMKRSPCLMGGGTYPATCPGCGANNHLFSTVVNTIAGFIVLPQN